MSVAPKLFRKLTVVEEHVWRNWAQSNYVPFTPIDGLWHPVVQDECAKINSACGEEEEEPTLPKR